MSTPQKRHGRLRLMLENEGEAPAAGSFSETPEAASMGGYNPGERDPSEAGALRSILWELALLSRHFHPHMAATAAALSVMDPGSGAFPSQVAGAPQLNPLLTPVDLARIHGAEARGEFRPGPSKPRLGKGGVRRRRLGVGLSVEAEEAFAEEIGREDDAVEVRGLNTAPDPKSPYYRSIVALPSLHTSLFSYIHWYTSTAALQSGSEEAFPSVERRGRAGAAGAGGHEAEAAGGGDVGEDGREGDEQGEGERGEEGA